MSIFNPFSKKRKTAESSKTSNKNSTEQEIRDFKYGAGNEEFFDACVKELGGKKETFNGIFICHTYPPSHDWRHRVSFRNVATIVFPQKAYPCLKSLDSLLCEVFEASVDDVVLTQIGKFVHASVAYSYCNHSEGRRQLRVASRNLSEATKAR